MTDGDLFDKSVKEKEQNPKINEGENGSVDIEQKGGVSSQSKGTDSKDILADEYIETSLIRSGKTKESSADSIEGVSNNNRSLFGVREAIQSIFVPAVTFIQAAGVKAPDDADFAKLIGNHPNGFTPRMAGAKTYTDKELINIEKKLRDADKAVRDSVTPLQKRVLAEAIYTNLHDRVEFLTNPDRQMIKDPHQNATMLQFQAGPGNNIPTDSEFLASDKADYFVPRYLEARKIYIDATGIDDELQGYLKDAQERQARAQANQKAAAIPLSGAPATPGGRTAAPGAPATPSGAPATLADKPPTTAPELATFMETKKAADEMAIISATVKVWLESSLKKGQIGESRDTKSLRAVLEAEKTAIMQALNGNATISAEAKDIASKSFDIVLNNYDKDPNPLAVLSRTGKAVGVDTTQLDTELARRDEPWDTIGDIFNPFVWPSLDQNKIAFGAKALVKTVIVAGEGLAALQAASLGRGITAAPAYMITRGLEEGLRTAIIKHGSPWITERAFIGEFQRRCADEGIQIASRDQRHDNRERAFDLYENMLEERRWQDRFRSTFWGKSSKANIEEAMHSPEMFGKDERPVRPRQIEAARRLIAEGLYETAFGITDVTVGGFNFNSLPLSPETYLRPINQGTRVHEVATQVAEARRRYLADEEHSTRAGRAAFNELARIWAERALHHGNELASPFLIGDYIGIRPVPDPATRMTAEVAVAQDLSRVVAPSTKPSEYARHLVTIAGARHNARFTTAPTLDEIARAEVLLDATEKTSRSTRLNMSEESEKKTKPWRHVLTLAGDITSDHMDDVRAEMENITRTILRPIANSSNSVLEIIAELERSRISLPTTATPIQHDAYTRLMKVWDTDARRDGKKTAQQWVEQDLRERVPAGFNATVVNACRTEMRDLFRDSSTPNALIAYRLIQGEIEATEDNNRQRALRTVAEELANECGAVVSRTASTNMMGVVRPGSLNVDEDLLGKVQMDTATGTIDRTTIPARPIPVTYDAVYVATVRGQMIDILRTSRTPTVMSACQEIETEINAATDNNHKRALRAVRHDLVAQCGVAGWTTPADIAVLGQVRMDTTTGTIDRTTIPARSTPVTYDAAYVATVRGQMIDIFRESHTPTVVAACTEIDNEINATTDNNRKRALRAVRNDLVAQCGVAGWTTPADIAVLGQVRMDTTTGTVDAKTLPPAPTAPAIYTGAYVNTVRGEMATLFKDSGTSTALAAYNEIQAEITATNDPIRKRALTRVANELAVQCNAVVVGKGVSEPVDKTALAKVHMKPDGTVDVSTVSPDSSSAANPLVGAKPALTVYNDLQAEINATTNGTRRRALEVQANKLLADCGIILDPRGRFDKAAMATYSVKIDGTVVKGIPSSSTGSGYSAPLIDSVRTEMVDLFTTSDTPTALAAYQEIKAEIGATNDSNRKRALNRVANELAVQCNAVIVTKEGASKIDESVLGKVRMTKGSVDTSTVPKTNGATTSVPGSAYTGVLVDSVRADMTALFRDSQIPDALSAYNEIKTEADATTDPSRKRALNRVANDLAVRCNAIVIGKGGPGESVDKIALAKIKMKSDGTVDIPDTAEEQLVRERAAQQKHNELWEGIAKKYLTEGTSLGIPVHSTQGWKALAFQTAQDYLVAKSGNADPAYLAALQDFHNFCDDPARTASPARRLTEFYDPAGFSREDIIVAVAADLQAARDPSLTTPGEAAFKTVRGAVQAQIDIMNETTEEERIAKTEMQRFCDSLVPDIGKIPEDVIHEFHDRTLGRQFAEAPSTAQLWVQELLWENKVERANSAKVASTPNLGEDADAVRNAIIDKFNNKINQLNDPVEATLKFELERMRDRVSVSAGSKPYTVLAMEAGLSIDPVTDFRNRDIHLTALLEEAPRTRLRFTSNGVERDGISLEPAEVLRLVEKELEREIKLETDPTRKGQLESDRKSIQGWTADLRDGRKRAIAEAQFHDYCAARFRNSAEQLRGLHERDPARNRHSGRAASFLILGRFLTGTALKLLPL